jgi:2-polyprenyl-3-methyl-5-hydroxy-6-metoxy-1,4-benzoquinol methylase
MGLASVFETEGLFEHSPSASQAVTGVMPQIGPIPFRSESCSSHHFLFACYQYWCDQIKEPPRYHRKQWEFIYILQALWERGMLAPEMRGLGFGVGREPLTAVMAARGCEVVATDLEAEAQTIADWTETAQHSATLEDLNERGICDSSAFAKQVKFAPVNMNDIPSDLRGFDFCWSACCFEHLGSIKAGLAFYKNSLETLKPGGFAIHTTEINLSSNEHTLDNDGTVLFRKKDLEELIADLTAQGHYCEPLFIHHGSQPVDGFIDTPPYRSDPHLRIAQAHYVTTSDGIITRKAPE